jgi:hypothetical protein
MGSHRCVRGTTGGSRAARRVLTYAGWIVAALWPGGGPAEIEEALHRTLVNIGIGSSPDKTRRTVGLIIEWSTARG